MSKKHDIRSFIRILFSASFRLVMLTSGSVSVAVAAGDIVISQIYGGGGNSSAIFKNDFVELCNRTLAPIDLSGCSVQYSSAGGSSWQVAPLSGSIQPHRYYLVQLGSGGSVGADLPAPDAIASMNMSATAGKAALVNSTTALSGACPSSGIIDLLGYGASANCYETAPTANLSNTMAAVRADSGRQDTDNNSADFLITAPAPRNAGYDPLPVQLVSFAATNIGTGEVRLDWVTISEVNNLGFYVQRKTVEGDAFADLPDGFVVGHGTTLVRQEYFYLDKDIQPGRRHYRLRQVDLDGAIHYSQAIFIDAGVDGIARPLPTMFILHQNYPNPFNGTTRIRYEIPGMRDHLPAPTTSGPASGQAGRSGTSEVKLVVYDMLGRDVATLVDGAKAAGSHTATLDASGLASGVYIYRITAGNEVQRKKLVILR
jgi:hypothetical protein